MNGQFSFYAALSAALLGLSATGPARADQVIADDLIVGKGGTDTTLLCVGTPCVNGETVNSVFDAIHRLKGLNNVIEFVDTSSSSNFPDRNWAIQANDTAGGDAGEAFFVRDDTSGTRPFYLEGGAPSNALFVKSTTGYIGLGTSLPMDNLHVLTSAPTAGVTLETAYTYPSRWEMDAGPIGFTLTDGRAATFPLVVSNGAPSYALWVADDGKTGLGTQSPEGKLHVKGNGVQLSYLESGDGGAVQLRFRTDSQNRRFLAVNNANQVKSQIIFKDNEILFTGATDSGANRWLTIGPSGIVSQGPTCNPGPCDATFDPEAFTVPSIEDHAAYMWENRHLWGVGPTSADEPFNLTQKAGGMLHELEIAHIYIDRMNARLNEQETEKKALMSRIARQEERLNALEAALTGIAATR